MNDLEKQSSSLLEENNSQRLALQTSEQSNSHIIAKLNNDLEETKKNYFQFAERNTTLAGQLLEMESNFIKKVCLSTQILGI